MPVFKMRRSYEPSRILVTDDLLSALKETCNYEGDLYVNNSLVMSCLGLGRQENTRSLLEYGITSYVNQLSNCWTYKYTDESKNTPRYYLNPYLYKWGDEMKLDCKIHDYRQSSEEKEFASLGEATAHIRETVQNSDIPFNVEEDIHVSYYGEGCLISFAAADWQREEGPELSILTCNGQSTPDVNGYFYNMKRYLTLAEKYPAQKYEFKPMPDAEVEGFQPGQVVSLVVDSAFPEQLDQDGLYLISIKQEVDGTTTYRIRDLDEYEISAEVQDTDITYPKLNKE